MTPLRLSRGSETTKTNKLAHDLVEIRQCLIVCRERGVAAEGALPEFVKLQSLAAHVPVKLDQRFREPAASETQCQLRNRFPPGTYELRQRFFNGSF